MYLDFLRGDVKSAIGYLNYNLLSEIRLRKGQPVIIEYKGEYKYLYSGGATNNRQAAIVYDDITTTLNRAMGGCIYSYAEQLKEGFITVYGGIRIGIAGEYVTQNGQILTIKNATSLNIRIPHNIHGCSDIVYNSLFANNLYSTLIYSVPGYGKTTMLRDLVINISKNHAVNILVMDVRNEIGGGTDSTYDLGERVDIIKSCDKLAAIKSAIRALKPQLIVTDELYGGDDLNAVKYACDCAICTIASSHICDKKTLKDMPFCYYVNLTGIGKNPVIYDKDFNIVCDSGAHDICRRAVIGRKEKENDGIQPAIRI